MGQPQDEISDTDAERRYGHYPFALQFGSEGGDRVRAYTLALYGWMNDQVGPIGSAWDVASTPAFTRLYFATDEGYATFVEAWGDLLREPMIPGLDLPIVPWPTPSTTVLRPG